MPLKKPTCAREFAELIYERRPYLRLFVFCPRRFLKLEQEMAFTWLGDCSLIELTMVKLFRGQAPSGQLEPSQSEPSQSQLSGTMAAKSIQLPRIRPQLLKGVF